MTEDRSSGRRLRAGVATVFFSRAGLARLALCAAMLSAATLLALPAAAAIKESDLLPVDEAFVLDARAASADRIELHWKIAEGYYLYKHRISVKSDEGYAPQPLQLPKGKAYEDEFFGKVETYRGQLTAVLPGQGHGGQTTLQIKYQGCADAGICYPPQTRKVAVSLPGTAVASAPGAQAASAEPAAPPAAAAPVSASPVVNFGPAGGGANPLLGGPATAAAAGTDALPLPPEQAFGFEAIVDNGNALLLRFTPARGYYLYRDKTSLKLDTPGIAPGAPRWPQATAHRDEHFGNVVVFFNQIDVPLPLQRTTPDAAKIALTASFQGCQTDGICYPPMTRTVSLDLPRGTVGAAAAASTTASASPAAGDAVGSANATDASGASSATGSSDANASTDNSTPNAASGDTTAPVAPSSSDTASVQTQPAAGGTSEQAEDSRLAAALSGPNRFVALLSFFGFGLLLAFTPCVLPMIPILSGLIAGHGPGLGARRAFALSFVYVLANALVFTVAGVAAGLVGVSLQNAFQAPWILVLFALLFVALALSSFGLYELQLPAALRNRVGALSDRQRSGSWVGVAMMGALSALIVGPCVAPPLAAAVLYIGQTQDPVFGGAALFLLAMGMGVPLLAFGVAAGRGLPTSGPWMVAVQRVFGFVFLGLAVWMLSRLLPGAATLALWGALLLGGAVAIGLNANAAAHQGVRVGAWLAALLLGLTGASQLIGALAGGHDPLQPLAGLRGGGHAAAERELPFRTIKSNQDLDREIAAAQAAGQPVLLDFYADWCVACKEMEKYTFPDPKVHEALSGFVLLKADVTANDDVDQALMKRLGIIGPPATLYYVAGAERRELRLFGFEKAEPFAQRAARAGAAR